MNSVYYTKLSNLLFLGFKYLNNTIGASNGDHFLPRMHSQTEDAFIILLPIDGDFMQTVEVPEIPAAQTPIMPGAQHIIARTVDGHISDRVRVSHHIFDAPLGVQVEEPDSFVLVSSDSERGPRRTRDAVHLVGNREVLPGIGDLGEPRGLHVEHRDERVVPHRYVLAVGGHPVAGSGGVVDPRKRKNAALRRTDAVVPGQLPQFHGVVGTCRYDCMVLCVVPDAPHTVAVGLPPACAVVLKISVGLDLLWTGHCPGPNDALGVPCEH